MPSPPLLEARSLSKNYEARQVLREVSITVQARERVALTGPSGSGKTTLLNCLGGVDRPDSGTLLFDGQVMSDLNGKALAELRRRSIGTIFQFFHLLPTLTAAENVEFPLQLLGVKHEARQQRVRELLERVGITHRAQALPSQLSGGEMQRVAIARAVAHQPRLLLADEPTGNLDSRSGGNILELLQEVSAEQGVALVLVTHSEEAAAICTRRIHLKDGRIVGTEEAPVATLGTTSPEPAAPPR
ncbi:ABC transporter ATP-binding protein [Verrucomicrobium sp. BvORR034]|uniref:ABC transporter ATP-binding protein n=1 Tax=Verrucomicrobium sp. BvORR034 TaxID=1396418 RepID=UPI0006785E25|nr:ABC transporter ATP-binding protein [Verrucomicrobium sp. BvORR034]